MESKKNISLNMIASLLVFIINLIINFFLTPYLTEKIGTEAYGFVSLANNFVNYATILTIALNSMASRFITIAIHQDKREEANKYFTSVFFANLFIILVLIVPAIVLILYLEHFFKIPENIIYDIKLLFSLIFLNFFVTIIDATYSIATFATNKLHLHSLRNMEGAFIKVGILIVLFSIFNPHAFYIGLATLISSIFLLLMDLFYTKKLLPFIKIKKIYFSIKRIKELVKAGIWNTVTKLGNLLTDGLDLIICNVLLDATAMGQLAIAKTLGSVMSTLISTIANIFQPQLTIDYAKENNKSLIEQLKTSMKTTAIFANIPLCFIIVFGTQFYSLWTPNQDAQLLNTLTILTIQGVIVSGIINPMYSIYTITNKIKVDAICRIIIGLISILIVYILLKFTSIGIYAVAGVSTLLGTIFNFVFVPIYTSKCCLNIKWYSFYPTIFRYMGTIIVILAVLFIIKPFIIINNWLILILTAIMVGIIGLTINYILLLDKADRIELKEMVNKILSRGEKKHE